MKTIALASIALLPLAALLPLRATPAEGAASLVQELPAASSQFENPASDPIEPGLVDWHPSFEVACAFAKESGKPVMLFQLLGRLDEEFC